MVVFTLAKKWILVFSLFISSIAFAHHHQEEVDPYFQITEVKTTKLEVEPFTNFESFPYYDSNRNLGEIVATIDKLVAIGTKIWKIVEKGKPTYTTQLQPPLHVIPKITDQNGIVADSTFYSMYGWSAPSIATHRVEYKNGWGQTVVSFDYQVHFQHGGKYDGSGNYIAGLTVAAKNINANFGFNLDVSARLISITNRGTMDEPIAGATIEVNHNVDTFMSASKSAESFHVTGTNEIIHY